MMYGVLLAVKKKKNTNLKEFAVEKFCIPFQNICLY